MSKLVFIQDIDLSASPRVRNEVRDEVVQEYAQLMKAKTPLPPVVLFLNKTEKVYLLADGRHRIEAAKLNKQKGVIAEVRDGNYEQALLYALVANNRHGMRRSAADRRQSVMTAIRFWPDHSNAQIAKACMVDDHLVAEVRKSLEVVGAVPVIKKRVAADGSVRASTRVTKVTEVTKAPEEEPILPRESRGSTKVKPLVIKDSVGYEIPEGALQYWNNSGEVYEMIGTLKSLRRELTRIEKEEDITYCEVNMSALIADLERAESSLNMAVPYAVCTTCQGHPETQPKNQCRMCGGRGVISKFRWGLVPEEIRKMREKMCK